jgi:hypothetical protein
MGEKTESTSSFSGATRFVKPSVELASFAAAVVVISLVVAKTASCGLDGGWVVALADIPVGTPVVEPGLVGVLLDSPGTGV